MKPLAKETNHSPFAYDTQETTQLLAQIMNENLTLEAWQWLELKASKVWLEQKTTEVANQSVLSSVFAQTPRKVGQRPVRTTDGQEKDLIRFANGFSLQGWTTDRLCRVWLLLQLSKTDEDAYVHKIESLFNGAEMNEQVALYSALPLLAYPHRWTGRCAEGIRSNIGHVLQAIMCGNPYPAAHLGEAAWNQMVLKAFFTDKPVQQIVGLDERANPELAAILLDYAHERQAAHRAVNPQLWRCVGKFVNERNFPDIRHLFQSASGSEKAAAALACCDSSYPPAKALLNEHPVLKNATQAGLLTWRTLDRFTYSS